MKNCGGDILEKTVNMEALVRKVQQQEDKILQLVKIIAATNKRIAELQTRYENIEKFFFMK